MRNFILALLALSLWSCDSQGSKKAASTSEEIHTSVEGKTETADNAQTELCLSKVGWEQAITGKVDVKTLAKILVRPEDPKVQKLVSAASEGKANCQ